MKVKIAKTPAAPVCSIVVLASFVAAVVSSSAAAVAETQNHSGDKPVGQRGDGRAEIETVEVTASVPLGGAQREQGAPFSVQNFSRELMDATRNNSMAEMLQRFAGGVSVADAQNNPLQPDLYFRGFVASPLLGSPQGLVVYQNGVRVNDIFADTVNWDLLPDILVDKVSLVGGANPGYGLNALGGAVILTTRTGFNSSGGEVAASYGSFGRRSFSLSQSGDNGEWGYFVAADHFAEDGWRDFSPTHSNHLYTALSWRGGDREVDFYLQGGDTELYGNGALPVSLLARDREAVFTHPDITENRLVLASLRYRQPLTDNLGLRANSFVRDLVSDSFNGDNSEFESCEDPEDAGFLCTEQAEEEGGGVAMDQYGDPVSSQYDAVNNISRRDQRSYGFTLELIGQASLARINHSIVAGVDVLQGGTRFDSRVEFAELTQTRGTTTSGLLDAEGNTELDADVESYAIYLSDTLAPVKGLNLTVSGRFNSVRVENRDRSGEHAELNAGHRFQRFNGGVGLTYEPSDGREYYAGVYRTSRVPTAVELACSHPNAPCLLPNTFLADPPLDDVVSQNVELGIRGRSTVFDHWSLGLFRTVNRDDIVFQSTGGSTGNEGFFSNVSDTRREGLELSVSGALGRGDWFAHYNYLRARFMDAFIAFSPLHPLARDEGVVAVAKKSDIPGIPRHNVKLGVNYPVAKALEVGVDVNYFSARHLRGDEANLLDKIDGYSVVNVSVNYHPSPALTFYLDVKNLFDKEYESFGLLGEVGDILADEAALNGVEEEASGERFFSPGEPFGVWLGVRYRWD